jgi:hypothetical protein
MQMARSAGIIATMASPIQKPIEMPAPASAESSLSTKGDRHRLLTVLRGDPNEYGG